MSEIKQFLGLRNTTNPERYRTGELEVAMDVELDDTGQLLSRQGQTVVNATPSHSLYSNHNVALLMQENAMKAIESNFSLTTLQTLGNSDPVSYDTLADTIYWSNGMQVGRLLGRTPARWGTTPPMGQPTAIASPGSLPVGRYLYAMTFVRDDGQESGTGVAGTVDLASTGGITFGNMEVSTSPGIRGKVLYLSGTNGEALNALIEVPNNQVSYAFSGPIGARGHALRTQFAGPPPAGTIVRVFNGTTYVVAGDTVFFSKGYSPELFDIRTDFLRFPGQVAMFECVKAGIYVGTADVEGDDPETTAATWYLAGSSPEDFTSNIVNDYGVIPGTATKCAASLIAEPGASGSTKTGEAVVWTSRHGACIGYEGGSVVNITEPRYSFPSAQRGAGVVRQHRGFVQYLGVLNGPGSANNQS